MARSFPARTFSELRDRAIFIFTCLTAGRGASIAAISIGDVDLIHRTAFFDGEKGAAKNGKGYTADFFPMPTVFEEYLSDWINYLKSELQYGLQEPLFPALSARFTSDDRPTSGAPIRRLTRGSSIVRKAFQRGCKAAGLEYFNPHAVRSTVVTELMRHASTWEEKKAVSQSMGHNLLKTTEGYSAPMSDERQAELMEQLRERVNQHPK